MKPVARYRGDFQWEGVAVEPYSSEEPQLRDVGRQVLAGADDGLRCELRYFEVQPGGHTRLERHRHAHAVVVLRGSGRALVGDEVWDLRPYDVVRVAPSTWHQLRADAAHPLGFLCMVDCERDRGTGPTPADLDRLRADPQRAAFIRL